MVGCPFANPASLWDDFGAVREQPGLLWHEPMGRWVVSRYDDIVAALQDPAAFSSKPVVPDFPADILAVFNGRVPLRGTLIGHDNPAHDRLRNAVNTFFMPRRIARYESWIEAQAHALIDEFYEEGELDLRDRFTSPLPLKVISHIVGLEPDRSVEYFRALHAFTNPTAETAPLVRDYHGHVEEVMEQRRLERRDDLISHVWNMRDSGEVVMTDFEMLSLFPGLMVAGHETSSNLAVMALAHLLARPGLYERAQRDDASRVRALEEAFRFEGPITGMPRLVTRPVTIGGRALNPGDEIFLAYGSGNREAAHFPDGDAFDIDRAGSTQHIAFGQGIHACLGAPLARLLLKVEMRVIADRLPGLRFAIPYDDRTYLPVREVRALLDTPFAWDVLDSHRARKGQHARPLEVPAADGWLGALVSERTTIANDVVEIVIDGADGPLPSWTPGAHAELELPNGTVRHYSLCGRDRESGRWTIAVRREEHGRGGSRYINDVLAVDARVRVRPPTNHFELTSPPGPTVLIGGGIGITPLLSMAEELSRRGANWQLAYLGRSPDTMAYRDRLTALDPRRVIVWASEARGRMDLAAMLADLPKDATIYCCGPERLVSSAEALCDALGLALRVERFSPMEIDTTDDRPFEIVLQCSGRSIPVAANETALQALAREGVQLLSTCQRGTCGSCEVAVVAGEVMHRDTVLTREERAANESMMVCVSRCAGDRLIVKL